MAQLGLLVSTVVTGVLLAALLASASSRRPRERYRPQLRHRLASATGGERSFLDSDAFAGLLAAAVLGVAAAAALGGPGVVLVAVGAAALGGYFAWGVYHVARVRGLPTAHAVGLSAWSVGVLLVGVLAGKLVLG